MNSQFIELRQVFRSRITLLVLVTFIPISLFFKAGFASISVIWLFFLSFYNVSKETTERVAKCPLLFLLILLFACEVLRVLFSLEHYDTSTLARTAHLVLLPVAIIILGGKIRGNDYQLILWFFVVAFVITSLVCLTNSFQQFFDNFNANNPPSRFLHFFSAERLSSPTQITPVYLSLLANVSLAIVISNVTLSKRLRLVLMCYLTAFIILLSALPGIISLPIIILVCFFYRKLRTDLILTIFLIAAIAGVSLLFPSFIESNFINRELEYGRESLGNFSLQLKIWEASLEAVNNSIFLGYGLFESQIVLEEVYFEKGMMWAIEQSYNPHNQFLSTALDLGLFGFLVLLLILFIPLHHSLKRGDILGVIFIIIIIIFFSQESVLVRQKGIICFVFFYSMFFRHINLIRDR